MAKKTNTKITTPTYSYSRDIVPKSLAVTRSDVQVWKSALAMAQNADSPKMFPYYNLVSDILNDAHLTSQIQNRKLKTMASEFSIKDPSGKVNEEVTAMVRKSKWISPES